MATIKTQMIHEFLARWDDEGNLKGCHVAYREVVSDGDEVIATRYLDPQPVSLKDEKKLAELSDTINVSTLADIESKNKQLEDQSNSASEAAEKMQKDHLQALADKDKIVDETQRKYEAALTAKNEERTKEVADAKMPLNEKISELTATVAARDAEVAKLEAIIKLVKTMPEGEALLKADLLAANAKKKIELEAAMAAAEAEHTELMK